MPSLEDILTSVRDKVIPEDKALEKAKIIVSKLVSTCEESPSILINEMKKCDVLFKSIFEGVFSAGLFCDGLKDVDSPNNFKLYFVLNLPFDEELTLSNSSSDVSKPLCITPGYSCLWSDKPNSELLLPTHAEYASCSSINDFFYYTYTGFIWRTYYYVLASSRVLQWFSNVVSTAVSNIFVQQNSILSRWFYNHENLFYDIGIDELGSAHLQTHCNSYLDTCLILRNVNGFTLNIQIQPVFNYQGKFLVPKPQADNASLWRLSNIKAEKQLLCDKRCVEETIRYLVKFCRMQGPGWEDLKNYHVKTVILQHLKNNPWLSNDLPLLFMGTLRDGLLECLARRKIPYYFDDTCNLLSGIDLHTIETIKERLERILKDIQKNPPITLVKYFTMKECNTETIDGSEPSYCSLM